MARRPSLFQRTGAALRAFSRGYDAASLNPNRWAPEARMHRIPQETLAAAPRVRQRARYAYSNNPFIRAAVDAKVAYALGAGAIPAHENMALVEQFMEWWDEADESGSTDFGGLQAQATRAMLIDGDTAGRFIVTHDGLRIQQIPSDQIDENQSRELGGGAFIASGVEFGANTTAPRAFWVKPFAPNAQFETLAPSVRVPAEDMYFAAQMEGIGQVRGISDLTAALLTASDSDLTNDALVKSLQTAALFGALLVDANGASALPFDGEKEGDALNVSLEPGMMRRLPPGYDVRFSAPQQQAQSIQFLEKQAERIAAATGVPAFLVSADVSKANFSSLKAATLSFSARLETLRWHVIVPRILNPIWRKWLAVESLRGNADAEAGLPEWRFPALPMIQPQQEVAAQVELLKAGLASRKELIEARGEDFARVNADIAADEFAAKAANENAPDNQEESSNA